MDDLTPFAPGTITRCPTCNDEITSMDREVVTQEEFTLVGDLMPDRIRILDQWFTARPCNHVFRGEVTLTTRRSK